MNTIQSTPHSDGVIYALEEIHSLPLPLDQPLYFHYPAMKLGKLQSLDFYSHLLSNMAIHILNNNFQEHGRNSNWVLTAPAYFHLPAAANLLARKVHSLLQLQGFDIELVEPRLNQQQIEIRTQDELNNYYNYSKNNLQQRIHERKRVQQSTDTDSLTHIFKNKSVIIINDINVTGTQQHFMRKRFDQLQVSACHWLYIFNIASFLAEQHPEIEFEINNSQIQDPDTFSTLLGDSQVQHTARCIGRLFNESLDNFHHIVSKLDSKLCSKLYQLAVLEGRYSGAFFDNKMNILAAQGTP